MYIKQLKQKLPFFSTAAIGMFFILILHFKMSYTLIPLLLSAIGVGLLLPYFRASQWRLDRSDISMIMATLFYFILILLSVWLHPGKVRELDLPSKLILMLPILAVCYRLALKPLWILYAVVLGTLVAAVVGISRFVITQQAGLFPIHMYIQSGGILMAFSLFCIVLAFYFLQQKQKVWCSLSLLAATSGIIGCLLNQARGAWVLSPIILLLILWWYRHLLSKWLVCVFIVIGILGSGFAGNLVQQRWQQAENEIIQYFEQGNGSTSVGGRLDMWKSSLIGIQEKPLFGHGMEGIKILRQSHYEQGVISKFASGFVNAHNQYLHDTTSRGFLGLAALLGLFLTPLYLFWKNSRQATYHSLARLWGLLGIVHILSTMGYCLTQSFLSHNSGMMFYGFLTFLFYGLQKRELKRPLVEESRC